MEVRLVERARAGDHAAFCALIDLQSDRCYALAYRILRDIERAQDAVQQTAAQTGLDRDSKAQAEQIRSIAVERLDIRLGVVPNAIMLEIDEALRLHLGL